MECAPCRLEDCDVDAIISDGVAEGLGEFGRCGGWTVGDREGGASIAREG